MIPIRDDIPSSRFPAVTLGIIIINFLVFLRELKLGHHLEEFLLNYAVIPARYTVPDVAAGFTLPQQIISFFTSMFLHGGWLHLIGNMWTLWIFGDNVEDRLGRARYLALYLAGGVAAALMHIFTNAGFRFYPYARVETLIPPLVFGPIFRFPALVFLGWWFLLQFFNGAMSLGAKNQGFSGIAWWAHVGGFLFGFVICLFASSNRRASAKIIDI